MIKKIINKIMIVDDSEENRLILEDICSSMGMEFISAENGKLALDLIRNHQVDCILLDIQMPVMSGMEFLDIIKRDLFLSVIPIIMVTGNEDTKSVVDSLNKGAADYITKPFEKEILIARIKGVLKRYETFLNEKELVEKTFFGSVKLLNDLMSSLSPQIFGKSNQIRRIAKSICHEINYNESNEIELAALFSHIGCISLSADIIEKLVNGKFLLVEEKQIYDNHPLLGYKLLKNIQLLENVSNTVLYQNKNYDGSGVPQFDKLSGSDIPLSARILKGAIEYQNCRIRANNALEFSDILKSREAFIDPNIYKALLKVMIKEDSRDLKELKVVLLKPGMIFANDVLTSNNRKIAAQWQEATDGIIERIKNIHFQIGVKEPIQVFAN
jgi:response regulator RpfG family c-di-GMP phosphodiesterase